MGKMILNGKEYCGSNQGGSGHNYSETEQEICVGANNKPVYEITKIVTGSYSKGSENVFTVNIANASNVRVTEGYIVSGSYCLPINMIINTSAFIYIYIVVNANNIELHVNSTEWNYTRLEITLRYQKTTD